MNYKLTKKQAKELVESKLSHVFGVTPDEAAYEHFYKAVSLIVRDMMIQGRKDFYERYKKSFEGISEIEMQPYMANSKPNHWLSAIILDKTSKIKPIDIIEALENENIESRPIWKPMHMQPFFKDYDFITLEKEKSIAQDIFERGACLPSDTKITDEEQKKVIKIIKKLFI